MRIYNHWGLILTMYLWFQDAVTKMEVVISQEASLVERTRDWAVVQSECLYFWSDGQGFDNGFPGFPHHLLLWSVLQRRPGGHCGWHGRWCALPPARGRQPIRLHRHALRVWRQNRVYHWQQPIHDQLVRKGIRAAKDQGRVRQTHRPDETTPPDDQV